MQEIIELPKKLSKKGYPKYFYEGDSSFPIQQFGQPRCPKCDSTHVTVETTFDRVQELKDYEVLHYDITSAGFDSVTCMECEFLWERTPDDEQGKIFHGNPLEIPQTMCKYCGDESIVEGTIRQGVQSYYCTNCQKESVTITSVPRGQYPKKLMLRALDLMEEGFSIREATQQLKKEFDKTPCPNTLCDWRKKHLGGFTFSIGSKIKRGQVDEVMALRKKDLSFAKIGKELGISHSAAYRRYLKGKEES